MLISLGYTLIADIARFFKKLFLNTFCFFIRVFVCFYPINIKIWVPCFSWSNQRFGRLDLNGFSLKKLIFSWKTFKKRFVCPQDMIGNFFIAKVWCCLGLYWSTRGCNLAAHPSIQRFNKIIDCCKNLVWIIILKIWRYGEIRVKCVAELTEEPIKVKTLYFNFF